MPAVPCHGTTACPRQSLLAARATQPAREAPGRAHRKVTGYLMIPQRLFWRPITSMLSRLVLHELICRIYLGLVAVVGEVPGFVFVVVPAASVAPIAPVPETTVATATPITRNLPPPIKPQGYHYIGTIGTGTGTGTGINKSKGIDTDIITATATTKANTTTAQTT